MISVEISELHIPRSLSSLFGGDALEMINKRVLRVVAGVTARLNHGSKETGCVGELQQQPFQTVKGFWVDPAHGSPTTSRSVARARGMGTWTAILRNLCFRVLIARGCSFDQFQCFQLLRAQSSPEYRLELNLFRTLLLKRFRLPLQAAEASCECGAHLDSLGRHRAACPCSGRLCARAMAPKRTIARVWCGAGATERCDAKLRETNVAVAASDERAVEVLDVE